MEAGAILCLDELCEDVRKVMRSYFLRKGGVGTAGGRLSMEWCDVEWFVENGVVLWHRYRRVEEVVWWQGYFWYLFEVNVRTLHWSRYV